MSEATFKYRWFCSFIGHSWAGYITGICGRCGKRRKVAPMSKAGLEL